MKFLHNILEMFYFRNPLKKNRFFKSELVGRPLKDFVLYNIRLSIIPPLPLDSHNDKIKKKQQYYTLNNRGMNSHLDKRRLPTRLPPSVGLLAL